MDWEGRRESDNIEDRRGSEGGFGGGGGFPVGRGGLGIVGIIVMLVGAYYGVDLSGVVGGSGSQSAAPAQVAAPKTETSEESHLRHLAGVVLADTEDVWGQYFKNQGGQYQNPKLVLYRGATQTGCGTGQSVMGPFYCPADQKVYLDLSFYDDMKNKLGADGDFAFAYVIAHEIGHHVQNQLGISDKISRAERQADKITANRLSVGLELQADCFAGVWANKEKNNNLVNSADVQQAIAAAASVGDDRLQKQSTGRVVPDSFTHGSSEQRMQWFQRGFQAGDPSQCNTFAAMGIH